MWKAQTRSLHTLGCPRSDISEANGMLKVGVEQQGKNKASESKWGAVDLKGEGGLVWSSNLNFKASIGIETGHLLDWSSVSFLLKGSD